MERFTFCVFAYNQEDIILETLESIRFQKEKYGAQIAVSLVVMDDCSKDRTVEVVQKWITQNRSWFERAEIIANDVNKGTVHNFCKFLRAADTEPFKELAGDDLISSENIFERYSDLTPRKIKTYFKTYLCDGKLSYLEKDMLNFYYNKLHCKDRAYNVKAFRKGCFFHSPSTLFTRELFASAGCEEALDGFFLFEDDPTWYSMLKNTEDLDVEFIEDIIVLYRIHSKSVSHTANTRFEAELQKLYQMYKSEASWDERLYFALRDMTWLPKLLRLHLYWDKIVFYKRKLQFRNDPGYKRFKEKIEKRLAEEQVFYDTVRLRLSDL